MSGAALAWLILTIKSCESVISVAGVCGTFHPELPPLLALVDGGLDVVEPVPDALLQPEVHPALRLLADGDGEVAPLVQQRDSVDVGQLQLEIGADCETTALDWFCMEMLALNRNSPISDSFELSFLKQWK